MQYNEKFVYSFEEKIYIHLELKKLLENHNNFPTLFVYPMKRFVFEGIFFDKFGITRKFELKKNSMEDTWKIKCVENEEFFDLESTSLYNTLAYHFG